MVATPSQTRLRERSGLHNLPFALTALVGRARELERVGATLRRTRLVTLTGPGGVGKTRLALAVAERQVRRHPGGVWLVDLSTAAQPPDVVAEVARVLGLGVRHGGRAADGLRAYLTDRDLLLVLDNCEHVVDACAELAADVLGTCAGIRILATSRESLGVRGETVWRLEPLSPEDAYRLFVERARQRDPDFVPSEGADDTIVQLCARLDRLPLAIELAAARVDSMSVAEILASLDSQIELGGAGRLRPPRHRTVRSTVEWSYRLLDTDEKEAFRNFAVFSGGFDAEAARAVVRELSVDLLARLVDKSLVAVVERPMRRTRYRLLETVREFAFELLDAAGDVDAVRELHLRHFAALADRAREEWLQSGRQRLVNELDDDYENVRAALERAAGSDPCAGLRVLTGARDLFYRFGQADGLRLAEQLLARCRARDRDRAAGLMSAGQLAAAAGDLARSRAVLTEARDLCSELGEPVLEAWIRWFQGLTEILSGRPEAGREHLEDARTLHRQQGVRIGEARALAGLGGSYLFGNDPVPAKDALDAALAIYVEEGDLWGQGQVHTFLGLLAQANPIDPSRATSHFRRAVELLRPFQDATLLPVALLGQAGILVRRDPARAVRVLAAASAIRDRVGGEFQPVYRARLAQIREQAEAKLGAEFERLWMAGARLSLEEATAVAFSETRPHPTTSAGLSAREYEVVALVAAGLPNKVIAARLHLSVRTVEVHVRHALAKLGLENRTQLATWARERAT
jgi:non-specific serine/threonine protein kinase